MAPHSSTLAWKIPWTEEPGGLQSIGLQRVRRNRAHRHIPYFYSNIGDKGSLLCLVSRVDRLFKGFHNIWDQKTNQKKKKKIPPKCEKMKRKNNKCFS